MNELSTEKTITTKELAEQLGTTRDVVIANARKCLPDKIFEQGKNTYWNKAEVTVLLDYMKTHTSNNRSVEFNSTVENLSTDLTPALKIKKALELMQEGYEEEKMQKAENLIAEAENGKVIFENTEKKTCALQVWRTVRHRGVFDWILLRNN